MTDLGQCSDVDSLRQAVTTLFEILAHNEIGVAPVNSSPEVLQDADGNVKYPTSDPPKNWIRFELDGAFSGGVANAHVISPGATTLTPNEAIEVTDAMAKYNAAVDGDQGYAQVMNDANGFARNEVMVMPGVGAPTGTDNYTVKFTSGADTAEYFDAKLSNTGTYNSATDTLVYFQTVAGPPHRLRAYIANVAAGTDEKVKVSSADSAASYLEDSFQDTVVSPAFSATIHNKVYFQSNGDTDEQLVAFTVKDDANGKVRVSGGDSLAYLQDQFTSVTDGTYSPSTHVPVFVDKSGGASLQIYIDGKVKVNVGDEMAYLENQFLDWEAPSYDADFDDLVIFNTATDGGFGSTDELRGYVPRETIMVKLTADVGGMSGTTLGCLSAASQDAEWVVLTSGTCGSTPTLGSQGSPVYVVVYNPSRDSIEASDATPIYLPAWRWEDGYILDPLNLWQLTGRVTANDQSIGHDASASNEWQDDGEC